MSPIAIFYNRVKQGLHTESALDSVNQTIVLHMTIYGIVGHTTPGFREEHYRNSIRNLLVSLAENWNLRELELCRKVVIAVSGEAMAYSDNLAHEDALAYFAAEAEVAEAESYPEEWYDDRSSDPSEDAAADAEAWAADRRLFLASGETMVERDGKGDLFGHMQAIYLRAGAIAEWLSDEIVNRTSAAEFAIQNNIPYYREFGERPFFVVKVDNEYFARQQGGDTVLPF